MGKLGVDRTKMASPCCLSLESLGQKIGKGVGGGFFRPFQVAGSLCKRRWREGEEGRGEGRGTREGRKGGLERALANIASAWSSQGKSQRLALPSSAAQRVV